MKFKALLLAGMFCVGLTLTAFAQTNNKPKKAEQEDAQPSRGQMTAKIFEIKHRRPVDLSSAVLLLGSGAKGAQMVPNPELKTISVRDYPENVAAIEIALKRLDHPVERESEPDIEFELHVLLATNTEIPTTVLPTAIRDVVKQLQNTLSYKNYFLLASNIQRTKVNKGYASVGSVEIPAPIAEKSYFASYSVGMTDVSLSKDSNKLSSIQINSIKFDLNEPGRGSSISTGLSLREGEKTVVGTATLRDKALVIVLSAKVLK